MSIYRSNQLKIKKFSLFFFMKFSLSSTNVFLFIKYLFDLQKHKILSNQYKYTKLMEENTEHSKEYL